MILKCAFFVIILILLMFLKPSNFEVFNSEYNFSLSIIYLIILIYFIWQNTEKNKNWLRFDILFLLGYTIVHFQIPFLASIGIEPNNPAAIWINKQLVNYATWMSLVAITTWMLGYTIRKSVKSKIFNLNKTVFKVNFFQHDVVLAVAFIAFLGLVGPSFLKGVYDGGRSYGEGANYAQLFLRVLLYLRIVYFFKDIPKGVSLRGILLRAQSNVIFLLILVIYVLLYLRAGDRGPIMQVALTIAGSYTLFVRPIPLYRLFVFIFFGLTLFSILKFGRGRDVRQFGDQNIIERGFNNLKNNDDTNFTDELATSVRIQYRALDIVPDQHPYLYGTSYFTMTVGSIVPFSGTLIFDPLGIPYLYRASSTFLNTIVKGENYESGDGSEILADIYINFGINGVFVVMFLFGVFSAHVYQKALDRNIVYILILIVLIYNAIYLNRAMLLTPLKDIFYILMFDFIFRRLSKK